MELQLKSYKNLSKLTSDHITRNHNFYVYDIDNESLNTFRTNGEMKTFLNLNKDKNFEIGKISLYDIEDVVTVYYLDKNDNKQSITFKYFEETTSFLRKNGIKPISIIFREL